jgi:hypothetical protein
MTGSDVIHAAWVALRTTGLQTQLRKLRELKDILRLHQLWSDRDQSRVDKLSGLVHDYLESISENQDSYAAHIDLIDEGPYLRIPSSDSGTFTLQPYVWMVDGHLQLIEDLFQVRLKRVGREIWNYLKIFECKLEAALVQGGIDASPLPAARYRLANTTLKVAGARRLRLHRFSLDMTTADLLAVTEVADALPQRPHLDLPAPLSSNFAAAMAAKFAADDKFREQFDKAFRPLTRAEITEVLRCFR